MGLCISSLIIPRLSDIYGRKKFTLFGTAMHVFVCILMLMSNSLEFSLVLIFTLGVTMVARVFVGFVWVSEHLMIKDVSKMTVIIFTIDALGIFFASLYFQHFKDWRYSFGMPLIGVVLGVIGTSFQYDSPKYHYSIGEFDKVREILTQIGRTNGKLSS